MEILKHLDKNHPHHAYLIEGNREAVMPLILDFLESLGIETTGSPDFSEIRVDSFKIDDASNLRDLAGEKGFSSKRAFVVSTNSFLLKAQNALLKMFEEPIENTIFFLIVPDINILLPTLLSRFYLIKFDTPLKAELINAEKFVASPLNERIELVKMMLTGHDQEGEEEDRIIPVESTRSNAMKFLNALEAVLHKKILAEMPDKKNIIIFDQMFKVREFLRQPGSSVKTLMESIALVTPNFNK